MIIIALALALLLVFLVTVVLGVYARKTAKENIRLSEENNEKPLMAKGEPNYSLFKKETQRQKHQKPYPKKEVKEIKQLFDDIKTKNFSTSNLSGRGIVICAGGFKYLTCAWVQIKVLRLLDCKLPIEMWHLKDEIPPLAVEAFEGLNVTLKNINEIVKFEWEGTYTPKILSVYFSSFKEVLFLDADNNCLRDPTYLFDCSEYKQHGSIFWPDFWHLERKAPIFDTYSEEPWTEFSQESGQMLIDKSRCQAALEACLQICLKFTDKLEHLFPVPDNYGDKDIWMSAWNGTNTPFYFIPHPTSGIGKYENTGEYYGNSMGQKDPEGNLLFLHKNIQKWHTVKSFPNWEVIMTSEAGDTSRWVERRRYELYGKSVKMFSFSQEFGNYEDLCWQVLVQLRAMTWYKKTYTRFIPTRNILWRQPIYLDLNQVDSKFKPNHRLGSHYDV